MANRLLTRGLLVAAFTLLVASIATPALAQGTGTLHGRVVDSAGNPVADAVLTFTYIGDYSMTMTSKSDAKGNWGRGGLLASGQWSATATKGDLVGTMPRMQVPLGVNTGVADIVLGPKTGQAAAGAPAAAGMTPLEGAVLATPVDSKGVPIKDLKAADWTVKEDGSTRQVSDAKPASEPLQIIMLVENSKYILPDLKEISRGMTAFEQAILTASPESQISVVGVSGQATPVVDFTKTTADIDQVFSHWTPSPSGANVILEAMNQASAKLARVPTKRRAIVIFHYEGTPESSQLSPERVVAAVMSSGASVWALSFRSSSQTIAADRDATFAALVPSMGGDRTTINTPNAITLQMNRIADALLGQYVVVYNRPVGQTPKALAMSVGRSGSKVFATRFPPGVAVTKTSASADEVAKHNKRQAELELAFKAGNEAFDAGNFDDALEKFKTVAAENDKCAACYGKLGDVYLRKSDLDNAEKSYLKAIDLDPTQADVYNALASLYNSQKKFEEAGKMSAKGNELKGATGGDANSTFNQGIIFWNQSKTAEAKPFFEKAVQMDPKLADAHYWLGMAIVNEGKLAESKKSFEEYLKLAPTGQYADTAKAILATIK